MVPFLLNCGYPVLIWDTIWSPPRVINKKGNTSTFCGPECEVSILNLSTLFLKYLQVPLSTKTAFSFLSGKNFPYVGIIHPLYTMVDSEVLFSDHHILLLYVKGIYSHQSLAFETIISRCTQKITVWNSELSNDTFVPDHIRLPLKQ